MASSTVWRTKMAVPLLFMVLVIMASNFMEIAASSNSYGSAERRLIETDNVTQRDSDDTVRIDPLDGFNKYRGGYDITNKHYWSSTVFTGIYGFAIAALWLLCGFAYGAFLLVAACCNRNNSRKLRKRLPCTHQCYLRPILLAIFFTILAITATGLVLGGNARFHSKAETVVDIIIDTADEASDTIVNTTGAMKNMSSSLEAIDQGGETSDFLTSTSQELDTQAADIGREARKHRRAINKGLQIVYIITTVIISLNLVAVIALSVLGILKLQRALRW